MRPIPPPRPVIHASPSFDFIAGRFADSSSPVAYFVTVMKYRDAAASLRLVSELPGASALDWKIEELYQREVDWNRVNKRILPYLRQTNQPQFFNAITVALLPRVVGRVCGMEEQGWTAPPLNSPEQFANGCIKTFGPITCGYWGKWTSPGEDEARLGQISWNMDQVAAVAIDGQHRLAAIKALQGSNPNNKSSVPVILVVAHPELGVNAGRDGASSVAMTRRLFIDLNKHAVKVSRTRQILLDDCDPVSICTRALVGSSLRRGGDEDFAEFRLPLTIVDWHTEQAKFDAGPYVTTILGLDWLVSECVGVPPSVDPMNYDAVQKVLDAVADSLHVSLGDAQQRLDAARKTEAPFEFRGEEDGGELAQIRGGFLQAWAPAILVLFRRLTPYANLLALRGRDGTLSPEFASWWVAKERRDSAIPGPAGNALVSVEEELRVRNDPSVAPKHFEGLLANYRRLKSETELAFSVAFQKAIFLAFNRFLRARIQLSDQDAGADPFGPDNADEEEIATASATTGESRRLSAEFFVKAINSVAEAIEGFYSRDALVGAAPQRRLWAHSLLREDESIDFTGTASTRASDLIISAVFLYLINSQSSNQQSFKVVWNSVNDAGAGGGVEFRLKQAVDRMAKESGLGGKIAAAKEPPIFDQDELAEFAREEVRHRLLAMWKAISR